MRVTGKVRVGALVSIGVVAALLINAFLVDRDTRSAESWGGGRAGAAGAAPNNGHR
ncbi:hypothetical protein [Nocardia sp. NPDC058497]|uniref:hypothetical protein n=1 Tax=Nocardia sp. NPDC058497 TaxID=3346529 RepID=UPI00364A7E96